MLIDTHCHLYGEKEYEEKVLNDIEEDPNFLCAITLSSNEEEAKRCKVIATKSKKVFFAAGFHPENASDYTPKSLKEIESIAQDKRCVAIGEVGLDYHYTGFHKKLQKQILIDQINLAFKLKKPICIHCRDAAEDLYEILKANKEKLKFGFVVHCFSENADFAQKFKDLGAYFGICGNFTFKNYDSSIIKLLPLDKIMVETDSPYLAPVPIRGQINSPVNVKYTVAKISEVLNRPLEEIERITTENALRFYGIKIEP